MSIDGVSGKTSFIGTSIIALRNQLNDLTQQLASGKVSTTYAGQGADRGFALSLRAQVSAIDAFADTATNVNTRVSVLNLALQGMSDIGKSVKSAASTSTIVPQRSPVPCTYLTIVPLRCFAGAPGSWALGGGVFAIRYSSSIGATIAGPNGENWSRVKL